MSARFGIRSRSASLLIASAYAALVCGFAFAWACLPANAAESLKLSCSAQVYEAFRGEFLESFRKKTGIAVNVDVTSSWAAVSQLSNGVSDVAATAEGLHPRFKAEGLRILPFCHDALVVITHIQNPVRDLTGDQLRAVFSGEITNWKDVDGPKLQVRVISPDKDTAAYKMFTGMVMRGAEVDYYLLTADSTAAAYITRRIAGAISFVNHGALERKSATNQVVRIDGHGPKDPTYPYFEVFSLVTKGRAAGLVKEFVDFTFSDEARSILAARGMRPIVD
jgi:phosphate transport system substrate-binding protein